MLSTWFNSPPDIAALSKSLPQEVRLRCLNACIHDRYDLHSAYYFPMEYIVASGGPIDYSEIIALAKEKLHNRVCTFMDRFNAIAVLRDLAYGDMIADWNSIRAIIIHHRSTPLVRIHLPPPDLHAQFLLDYDRATTPKLPDYSRGTPTFLTIDISEYGAALVHRATTRSDRRVGHILGGIVGAVLLCVYLYLT